MNHLELLVKYAKDPRSPRASVSDRLRAAVRKMARGEPDHRDLAAAALDRIRHSTKDTLPSLVMADYLADNGHTGAEKIVRSHVDSNGEGPDESSIFPDEKQPHANLNFGTNKFADWYGKKMVSYRVPVGDGRTARWFGSFHKDELPDLVHELESQGVAVHGFPSDFPKKSVESEKYAKPKRGYTPSEAAAVARSANTDQLHQIARQIGAAVGLQPLKTRDAIHDTVDSSVPSIAQAVYSSPDPETSRYTAAFFGLLSNTPALAVFHVGDGPDSVYKWSVNGGADEIRRGLNAAGIKSRVLLPNKDGFDVMVVDKGRTMRPNIENHARANKLDVQESTGTAEVIGGEANGPTTTAGGRKSYRDIIKEYENGGQ